jgi:hypothetical protein
MSLEIVNGPTIPGRGSLSDGVDVSAGQVIRITCPEEWTPANISFQISSDGLMYNSLYNQRGEEIVLPCGPKRAIVLNWTGPAWRAIAFLKIRSGSEGNLVPQPAPRQFAIAIWVGPETTAPAE